MDSTSGGKRKDSSGSGGGKWLFVAIFWGVFVIFLAFARPYYPVFFKQMRFLLDAGNRWVAASPYMQPVAEPFQNVQKKIDALSEAEQDDEKLRAENTFLRMKLESMRFDCHIKDAEADTKTYESHLSKVTGSRLGRSLASIDYRVPEHLLPPQLYALGVSYFKSREDEKAAVIFSYLTNLDDNDAYKTPRNYLLTAVSWYRLDNFELANESLDKILKFPEANENLSFLAQARLWKALVSARLANHASSQHWLRELVDHHPYSTEAGWINVTEVKRVPASEE